MAQSSASRRDRQIVRILGILDLMLQGGQFSVHQLAAKFGTRRETIYRDLRAIQDAGYPLCGDEFGRLSHPRLVCAARRPAPHLRLSDEEIAALLWAVAQTSARSPFRQSLRTASTKLRAMASQEQAAAIDHVVVESGWGFKDYAPHRQTILMLVEAILKRRRLEVVYRSPSAPAAKTYPYDPYCLLSAGGGLYCLGRVPHHEEVITLAVDRIQRLEITEGSFEVDPSFDPNRHRRESFGVAWEKPMDVTVRFSAGQAPYVRERLWHPTQTLRDLPDGGVELTFKAGGTFEIIRWILGWGDAAEVLSPPTLREQLRQILASARANYD